MIPLTREEVLDAVASVHQKRQELAALDKSLNDQAEGIMNAARAQVDALRDTFRAQRRTLNQDIKALEDRLNEGKPS